MCTQVTLTKNSFTQYLIKNYKHVYKAQNRLPGYPAGIQINKYVMYIFYKL